ncbi:SMP-30/gluconolactonase/LRE family protein [Roseovarius sp. 2305UL8-3]|uniref:SMP-30/gluconolactonase/LRE family protein n=1 Tax=Roseovarius conchicola TaxID=3121636 RepID=UPI003529D1C4
MQIDVLPDVKTTLGEVPLWHGGGTDGSTVDGDDFLWSAKVYARKFVRYAPNSKIDRVIEMSVKKVASVNLGWPNLDMFYVTSMGKPPLPRFPGDALVRGSQLAVRGLGVQDAPEPRFGA